MSKKIIILVMIISTMSLELEASTSQGYLINGFEGKIGTAYTREMWENSGFTTTNWDNGLDSRSQISDQVVASGDSALQIMYPSGNYGSQATGVQVELALEPLAEYYASYQIQFADDFSWGTTNRGGKLPGLTGGERCGSDFKCDGTDGFGARFMWRYAGYPELYLYAADMENGKYGDSIPFMENGEKVQFETGRWYTISEHVKLNTSASADDGLVEIWLDGTKVVNKEDITFITNEQQIDTFYFSSFHGGHDETWAPQVDSYAYFDNLKISPNANDIDY